MFRGKRYGPAVSEDVLHARFTRCPTAAFNGKMTFAFFRFKYSAGETDAETHISHRQSRSRLWKPLPDCIIRQRIK